MIKSFQCKETKIIFNGTVSRKFPQNIQQRARRKLRMLNNAKAVDDLRIPPSNHLEKLMGDRLGQYSIKINDQWRICFVWQEGMVSDVEIVDYH
ncbi:MAG: type II toxin-antitoxin system RelE/ParE family toxin [Gammaproteobacteria bacterium]|nr:type II toxin-antitoxin system RelE/ParE family toxin [Gammaproteobacteria bacterium]